MMQKAWGNEEVPYNFSRSSIKFQGHMGWKIDNLNPIWAIPDSKVHGTNMGPI